MLGQKLSLQQEVCRISRKVNSNTTTDIPPHVLVLPESLQESTYQKDQEGILENCILNWIPEWLLHCAQTTDLKQTEF